MKCDRMIVAKGLCRKHYSSMYYSNKVKPSRKAQARIPEAECLVPSCGERTTRADELCANHSRRRQRWGLTTSGFIVLASVPACQSCGEVESRPGKSLAFDHDHSHCENGCADCIRGVLCSSCNQALGMARESHVRLQKLADYIKERGLPRNGRASQQIHSLNVVMPHKRRGRLEQTFDNLGRSQKNHE